MKSKTKGKINAMYSPDVRKPSNHRKMSTTGFTDQANYKKAPLHKSENKRSIAAHENLRRHELYLTGMQNVISPKGKSLKTNKSGQYSGNASK
jgi:hypothetical protein